MADMQSLEMGTNCHFRPLGNGLSRPNPASSPSSSIVLSPYIDLDAKPPGRISSAMFVAPAVPSILPPSSNSHPCGSGLINSCGNNGNYTSMSMRDRLSSIQAEASGLSDLDRPATSRLPSLMPSSIRSNGDASNGVHESCQFPLEKSEVSFIQMALGEPNCGGCGLPIQERFLAKVADELWHESCLLCSMCGVSLIDQNSCFMRDRRIYCREDYRNVYYPKCGRCFAPVSPNDMVYRCLSAVYHLHCFTCYYCGAHLQKGDQYTVVEGQLVCAQDYEMMVNSTFGFGIDPTTGESTRKAPKRPRTILTSSQRRAFKASFEMSAKPCRKVREALAKETGLSVRVVQVWFQNQRAKMKKIQRKQDMQKIQEARKQAENGGKAPIDSKDDSNDKPMSPEKSESIRSSDSNYSSDAEEDSTPIDKLYSMQDSYFF